MSLLLPLPSDVVSILGYWTDSESFLNTEYERHIQIENVASMTKIHNVVNLTIKGACFQTLLWNATKINDMS